MFNAYGKAELGRYVIMLSLCLEDEIILSKEWFRGMVN